MNNTHTRAEKIAKTTALLGIIIVILMPFFSIPFEVPYPFWAITPMEHSIYLFCFSILVLLFGAPASLLTIRNKRKRVGWLSLACCLLTWPLGVAAIYFVAFLFGKNIN
jgi:hypothetical protein